MRPAAPRRARPARPTAALAAVALAALAAVPARAQLATRQTLTLDGAHRVIAAARISP